MDMTYGDCVLDCVAVAEGAPLLPVCDSELRASALELLVWDAVCDDVFDWSPPLFAPVVGDAVTV